MNYEKIKPYIEQKLVSEQVHPENEDVRIFNYTQKCQFDRAWDDVTRACRGLIINVKTGEVIARPFSKFFNYAEHVQNAWPIPNDTPVITEKLDGSLGILYWLNGHPWIATRGSFMSDQAQWATKWFRENVGDWNRITNLTHLFEIVAPWNRIVVNYDYEALVHIATINKDTGETVQYNWPAPIKTARVISGLDIQELARFLQEGDSRNDSRKYEAAPQRKVEAVPGVSTSVEAERLQEKQKEEVGVSPQMEQSEQGESERLQEEALPENTKSNPGSEGWEALHGLHGDVPTLRDGFRSPEGQEVQRGSSEESKTSLRGNSEVRSGMFELPSGTNVETENSEGFVIFYPKENVRMKIKFPEYVRLHKIITGVSEIGVWEILKDNGDFAPLLEKVPDEFFKWVGETKQRLVTAFDAIAQEAVLQFAEAQKKTPVDRKAWAEEIKKMTNPGIGFAILDDKDYKQIIWKMVRPHGPRVFKTDIDL